MRGAADGLNIVVPFGDPRYREVRPVLGLQAPRPQDDNPNNGPFGSVIDLDGKFGLYAGLRPFKDDLWDKKLLAIAAPPACPADPLLLHSTPRIAMNGIGKTGDGLPNCAWRC